MNMVEKVARALCVQIGGNPDSTNGWTGKDKAEWELYTSEAKAAIAAMREPSEAMVNAGRKANALLPGNGLGLQYVPPEPAHRAMIDAALAEGGGK